MLFSQNPISGVVEVYTDDGEYVGIMTTMGDDVVKDEKDEKDDPK